MSMIMLLMVITTALKVRENRVNWYTDSDGWNALHVAFSVEQNNCIEHEIINSGIDVNRKTNSNDAALDIAANIGKLNIVDLLIK